MNGRPTHVQKTARPDTIWPFEWPTLSKKQKQEVAAAGDDEKTRLPEACRKKVIFDVSSQDTQYLKVISEARAKVEK